MIDHEIERIAAAINRLRPDWPKTSLETLLRKPELRNRPRRDVAVALAWVACEAQTVTPARVLEAGPWWKAAGVEGQAARREPFDRGTFCGICHLQRDRCRALWPDDHEFISVHELEKQVAAQRAERDKDPDAWRAKLGLPPRRKAREDPT